MYKSLYTGKRSLLSLATAIALVSSGVSLAQEESDESAADELEEIVVTGTRLQKSSFEQKTGRTIFTISGEGNLKIGLTLRRY